MHKRRVRTDIPAPKASRSGIQDWTSSAEEARAPRSDLGIDELAASPWVGLHYRHEYMLHYRHESLEQRNDDRRRLHS